jgi:hypothetical protein
VSTVSNKRKKSSERSFEEPPPPVPCTLEEMMAILNKWVADGVVKLPKVSKKITEEDKKNPKFCYFHQYVHHSIADAGLFEENFMRRFKTELWNSLKKNKGYILILSSSIRIEL